MSNNNLELALRVRADVAQAMRQLNTLVDEIEQTGQATQQAQQQSQRATIQTTQAVREQARALDDVSDSLDLDSSIRQTQRLGDAMDNTARSTHQNIDINQRMEQSLQALTPHFVALIGLSGGLMTATMNALEKSSQLKNLSTISGMNVEQFQYYASGAKSVGIEMEKLSDIFKDTRDKVGDFLATGGGELQDFFEVIAPKVGITAEQFRHLSGADALQLYVDSLRKANVSENEMIFYMESIADEASALLPLLNQGGEGFRKYGEQAKQAGTILSEQTVNDALQAKSAISSFQKEMEGVGNRIIVNMIPAIQFVSQHFDVLAKAGIIVASVFAGRMASSFILTTVEMIKVQATTMATAVAQARLGEVSLLTATRLNALALASRLLTASGGLIGLGVAVASTIAGFLLMRKSSDQVSDGFHVQAESVEALKDKYQQLNKTQLHQEFVKTKQELDEVTDLYQKASEGLKTYLRVMTISQHISAESREELKKLLHLYETGTINADELATRVRQLTGVNQDNKNSVDGLSLKVSEHERQVNKLEQVMGLITGTTQTNTQANHENAQSIIKQTQAMQGFSREYQDFIKSTKDSTELAQFEADFIEQGLPAELAKTLAKAQQLNGADKPVPKHVIDTLVDEYTQKQRLNQLTEKDKSPSNPKTKSTVPVADLGDGFVSNQHLKTLKIKSSEAISGGQIRGYTAEFAQIVQKEFAHQLKYFSAFNDSYHVGRKSHHNTGQAFDIVLKDSQQSQNMVTALNHIAKQFGYSVKILDEYKKPSKHSTGGHIHVSVLGQNDNISHVSTKNKQPTYSYSDIDIKDLRNVQKLVRGSKLVDVAQQYGVPIQKVEALMMQESRGKQYAKSPTGALGYFQTTSGFRKQWGLTEQDSYDLVKSGTATIKALAQAFKKFGHWDDAILAHNAGEGGVTQFKRTGRVNGSEARNREVREYNARVAKWETWLDGRADESSGFSSKDNLAIIQAEIERQKQQLEKQVNLRYQFASPQEKAKIDHEKLLTEIDNAGYDEVERLSLRAKAEDEYQEKITQRSEKLKAVYDMAKQEEQKYLSSTMSEYDKQIYDIEHQFDEFLAKIAEARQVTNDPQHLKDFDDMEHKIKIIIDKEKLKAEYDNAMSELDKLQAEKQQKLDILQQRYDSSNMTAHEFHTQKTVIDDEFNPRLQDMAMQAQQVAYHLNDAFNVEKLNLFIAGLQQAQTSFQQFLPTAEQLNDRITNGLTDAFFAFADGTKSAEEAFREFASTFFREIAQMILKQMIFNAISSAGKAGGGGWGGMLAGVVSSAFGGKGYSSGGYTGAGGKYEPAGIVHRDEFVIRKEMTSQVGAKEFLANFNRYGMTALKGLQGYSSGGLVGAVPNISAPQVQAPKLVSPSEKIAQSTSFNANQNFYLVDDPSRILDTLNSSQGQENLVVMMSRDPEKFKTALKIG